MTLIQVQIWQYLSAASSFQSVFRGKCLWAVLCLGSWSVHLKRMCKTWFPFLSWPEKMREKMRKDESSQAQSWICQVFALPDFSFSCSLWSSPAIISAHLPTPGLPFTVWGSQNWNYYLAQESLMKVLCASMTADGSFKESWAAVKKECQDNPPRAHKFNGLNVEIRFIVMSLTLLSFVFFPKITPFLRKISCK